MNTSLVMAIRGIKAEAWGEGYLAGDPYHRRGNPESVANPYREPLADDGEAHA